MSKLIIKGALYFNGEEIIRPHFTGELFVVDCTQYKTKEQIESEYPTDIVEEFTGDDSCIIHYKGNEYYECESGPCHTVDMELLSDLSDIEFFDESTTF